MTEENNETEQPREYIEEKIFGTKQILRNIGKTLATIVCPPVGLSLWVKKRGEKIRMGVMGILSSMVIGGVYMDLQNESIYDVPKINMCKRPVSSLQSAVRMFACPLSFILSSDFQTVLETSGANYRIWKKDAINFEDGKYNLNFSSEDCFGNSKICLESAEQDAGNSGSKFRALQNQGDIFAMREARDEYFDSQDNLELTRAKYNRTKQAFEGAVKKMNSELEKLAVGIGQ